MGDRRIHWRCFHCGDTFTKAQERWAREHFGRDESAEPVCLMRVPGEGSLLTALRNAQDELDSRRAEDTDLMRALYAMQGDHAAALVREEERGYSKGVRDARAEPHPRVTELVEAIETAWRRGGGFGHLAKTVTGRKTMAEMAAREALAAFQSQQEGKP